MRAGGTGRAVSDGGAGSRPRGFAVRKAQSGDRAAGTVIARALQIKARLDRQPAQRGANGLAFHLQRVGRQMRIANLPSALELDRSDNRPVGINTTLAAR